jgi:hypothetical protein
MKILARWLRFCEKIRLEIDSSLHPEFRLKTDANDAPLVVPAFGPKLKLMARSALSASGSPARQISWRAGVRLDS